MKTVTDDQWRSLDSAAQTLGVSARRVRILVSNNHLKLAGNEAGTKGVTLDSLERERTWRAEASTRAKAWRFVKDLLWAL